MSKSSALLHDNIFFVITKIHILKWKLYIYLISYYFQKQYQNAKTPITTQFILLPLTVFEKAQNFYNRKEQLCLTKFFWKRINILSGCKNEIIPSHLEIAFTKFLEGSRQKRGKSLWISLFVVYNYTFRRKIFYKVKAFQINTLRSRARGWRYSFGLRKFELMTSFNGLTSFTLIWNYFMNLWTRGSL